MIECKHIGNTPNTEPQHTTQVSMYDAVSLMEIKTHQIERTYTVNDLSIYTITISRERLLVRNPQQKYALNINLIHIEN